MNRKPLNKISDEDIATYNDKGVVCLRQMFDKDWVDRMHVAVQYKSCFLRNVQID